MEGMDVEHRKLASERPTSVGRLDVAFSVNSAIIITNGDLDLVGRFQTTYGALRDFSRVAELLSIQLTRLRASLEDPTPSASLVSSVREIDQRDGPLQRYKTSMLILIDDLRGQDEKKMFIEIVIVKKAVRYVLLMMDTLASLARLCFGDTLDNLPYILPYLCIAVDC